MVAAVCGARGAPDVLAGGAPGLHLDSADQVGAGLVSAVARPLSRTDAGPSFLSPSLLPPALSTNHSKSAYYIDFWIMRNIS